MANQKIRIRLRAYDHEIIDSSAEKIVEAVKRSGAKVSGPIPLPTEKEVITILRAVHKYKDSKGGKMANQKIRIRLRAYDHEIIDSSAEKIVEAVKRSGAKVSGPIPLPTEKEVITILRAVHKYKDSREQFEQRTHKRLIDIIGPNAKTLDSLKKLNLPAGVDIEIKL